MKRQVAVLALVTLALGMMQLPGLADVSLEFGTHDRNHDGRWNYSEFDRANRDYYHRHPDVVVVNHRTLHRDYRRLDMNNDGYLSPQEVQTYRTWD